MKRMERGSEYDRMALIKETDETYDTGSMAITYPLTVM